MVDKPIYCAQAFGSISIDGAGKYVPCCNIRVAEWQNEYFDQTKYTNVLDNANNTGLKRVRKELIEGVWPSPCANCKEAEDNGYDSMRTIWNRELADHNIQMQETLTPDNIFYLDTTFSTKCNSKCMTCNPMSSDFWEKEHNYIWNSNFKSFNRVNINEETTQDLVDNFPNVIRVSFIGGEPTIAEEHTVYLKKLIESGRSKDIKISYVTNLTGLTDELMQLWKHFKAVHVGVSIDGYKEVNEYIRYPFKWSKVESTLRTVLELTQESFRNPSDTQFTVGLSCTISLFNAIQCFDLLDFYFDILTEYKTTNNQSLVSNCTLFTNYVTYPSFTMVSHLSSEYRAIGIDKGNRLLEKMEVYASNNNDESINQGFINSVKLAISWLKEEQIHNKMDMRKLKHFIASSDKFRNRDIRDFIPELYEELEKLW